MRDVGSQAGLVDDHVAPGAVRHRVQYPAPDNLLRVYGRAIRQLDEPLLARTLDAFVVDLGSAQGRAEPPFRSCLAALSEEDDVVFWETRGEPEVSA